MVLYTRKHTVSSQPIYAGTIFNVRVDMLDRGDKKQIKREVVEHNGGVVIVAQPSDHEVFLIKQYRYSVDEELLELPAGRVDAGEDRFAAAKRELIEEIGYEAKTWQELPPMYSAPGFCTELLSFYRATDLHFVGTSLDEDEDIEVMRLPLSQAWDLVVQGKVRDCKSVAGIGLVCHPSNLINR